MPTMSAQLTEVRYCAGSAGASVSPYPRMSGAIARNPAALSARSWCRQENQSSGQPWHITTGKPSPASAMCMRMPFARIERCRISVIGFRRDSALSFAFQHDVVAAGSTGSPWITVI
jgi:hypothetical protein